MTQAPLTIDDFYSQNEARRTSAEFEFGDLWSDHAGHSYELSWVEATGELYLMLEPEATVGLDAFGDFWTGESAEGLEVVVVGTLATHDEVIAALTGWEEAMTTENSLTWLYGRLATS